MANIWFDRHLSLEYRIEQGIENVDPEIWKSAMEAARKVIKNMEKKTWDLIVILNGECLMRNYLHLGGY